MESQPPCVCSVFSTLFLLKTYSDHCKPSGNKHRRRVTAQIETDKQGDFIVKQIFSQSSYWKKSFILRKVNNRSLSVHERTHLFLRRELDSVKAGTVFGFVRIVSGLAHLPFPSDITHSFPGKKTLLSV